MGNLTYDHVQDHITGSFRPKLVPSVQQTSGPGGNGGLLLEDGTSYLLMEDGSSFILME